jgi:hypothetical protein
VLPETKPPREVFGSWDVTDPNARPPSVPRHSGASDAGAPRPPQQLREPQALRTSVSASGL